jgi:FAD-dependent oxidoreductase domain-containing protein 1
VTDEHVDVVIVGGGVMGCASAYHLLTREPGLDVVVVERDPTYEFASTPRSAGGVRQQFSLRENVAMSRYGLDFYKNFAGHVAVDGDAPDVGLRQQGYLFLFTDNQRDTVVAVNAMQRDLGAVNELLEPPDIARRFPSLDLDGVALGSFGPEDGWMDPHAILQGFRKKAAALGARHVTGNVRAFTVEDNRARAVILDDGRRIAADHVVCAAGAWSAPLLETAGIAVPVDPVRRMVFYFEIREELEALPLTIDPKGFYFRPEGRGYICGKSNLAEPAGDNFEVDHDWFDNEIWPDMAARCPAFEALKVINAWSGLYDINRLDENMIIGPWPTGPANLHVLCGFSGHGLQQAPAAGRAIAELVLDGCFSSLDLSRFGCARIAAGEALPEAAIV